MKFVYYTDVEERNIAIDKKKCLSRANEGVYELSATQTDLIYARISSHVTATQFLRWSQLYCKSPRLEQAVQLPSDTK